MKKNFRRLTTLLLLFLILWGGMMVWKQFGSVADPENPKLETSFQQWFWLQRSPDLAVQIGLIFAGALGIATLLPGSNEEDI